MFFVAPYTLGRDQLQALMMRLHRVPADKRIALLGRLKHLQRLGWPPGSNLGKGRRVKYQADQVLLVAWALELIQLGFTPERAVATLRGQPDSEWTIALLAVDDLLNEGHTDALIAFDPAILSSALGDDDEDQFGRRLPGDGHFLENWQLGGGRRLALINIGALILDLDRESIILGYSRPGSFLPSLRTRLNEVAQSSWPAVSQ
jgi:hypothetical protein